MTRKEEIENAANAAYPYIGGTKGYICQNSIPIFIRGAEWADKTMIEKACKWLKENVGEYLEDVRKGGYIVYDIDAEQLIEDFKKAIFDN